MTKKWKTRVKINGRLVEVYVEASSVFDAKGLFVAQYGKENVNHPVSPA